MREEEITPGERAKEVVRKDEKTPRERTTKLKIQMASFRMALFRLFALKFRLFTWRVSSFVFCMALFRLFPGFFFFFLVFSTFRVACFPREKTKRHYSATIVDRLSYFVLTVHDILISDGHLISELRHFIIN